MKKLIAAALGALTLSAPAIAEDAVIHAGHVLAKPGEGYLTRQTILVEDGRIVSITAGYSTPKNYTVINLRDAYVLPGLIDSHVHITSENGPGGRIKDFEDSEVDTAFDGAAFALVTLKAGFTTVQDVGAPNDSIFGLRDAIARGAVPGPRMRASGSSVAITGGHGDINGYSSRVMAAFTGSSICNGADDCRRAVRQQIKEGADLIKITATGGVLSNTAAGLEQQFTDEELAAIVDAAHKMGRKVTAHAHGKSGVDAALRAGIDSIEHGTYLDAESIALFKQSGAILVPTVLAGATVTGWTNEPWLPAPSRAKAAQVGPLMLEMLRRAHEGGVAVAFGTDTGVSRHGDNAREFALMVEAGFTPEEAIRSATVVASEHLEMAKDIGTLEPGKYADLIAVTKDPLKDIRVLEAVEFVMKGGEVYKSGK
ncbi:amidohydrolase family protein [Hyphomonas polymorpha PS728]|uniref:Amidohydrolase family protein n=1 Tax=Hyphomonas polymorpha PS728 TaxID=1280954 RepID=A0A062VC31_9PROT|nr:MULTISPECIES: amidohydrolase family protein [Hyphomonas]AXE65108.1 Xaa-Pro dipeptidase [Hyphomonas sp. CACIAM 19H1]KCZ97803.1 amidohydrolase family protein [Hyphomonas polymorpha PS728]